MRPIGFSTGAIAKHDFGTALSVLRQGGVRVVELSALRLSELGPLAAAIEHVDLHPFDFVSFHAPSRYEPADEPWVIDSLACVVARGIPVIVHPDVIFDHQPWNRFGPLLLVENMDKRKPVGRT